MVDKKIISKAIVGILIIGVIIAAFFVVKPLLLAIFLGVFTAYVAHPLYFPIKKKIKNENLATSIFCIILLLVLAIPFFWFLPTAVREIFNIYMFIQKIDISSTVGTLLSQFLSVQVATAVAVQVNLFIANFFNFIINSISATFSDFPTLLIKFGIFIFTFYFATKDSEKIKKYLLELSPLSKATEDKFAKEFRNVTNSVMLGQVLVGIIQGLTLGIGLWILGVPKVLFLTLITMVTSIIPILGSWLVWIPVSLYLITTGHLTNGIILFLYGLFFVGTIDNVLRSYLISKYSNLNIFIAIIGVIGGLYAFGAIGIVLGPLVLSYLLIIIEFYREGKLNELFKE